MKKLIYVFVLSGLMATGISAQSCLPTDMVCETSTVYCGYYLNTHFMGNTFFNNVPVGNFNFCGTLENTQFLKLVPCSSQLTVTVIPSNCSFGNGLQIALLEECYLPIACNGGGLGLGSTPITLTATVEPGKPYILLIDGYLGDFCEFTLDIQGVDDTPPGNGSSATASINFQTLPCGPSTLSLQLPGCPPTTTPGCSQSWSDYYLDSCLVVQWNLPPGMEIISPNPGAFTVTVQFNQTVTAGAVSATLSHTCPGINPTQCVDCIPGCCSAFVPPIIISSGPSTFTDVPCEATPLYCAGSLDLVNFNNGCTYSGYTWWQPDFWNAVTPCFSLENPNLYAIAACGDVLNLDIQVNNCENNQGLEFALMGGGSCDNLYPLGSCISIPDGSSGQMNVPIFNNPDNIYYLVVDGINLDACDFDITANQLDSSGQTITNCGYGADPFIQVTDSTYTVLFSVNSFPGTQVTGGNGTLINNIFTSDPIPCGTPYNFSIISAGACTQTLAGDAPCLLPPPTCADFNLPAPLADLCGDAPLLCGNFLEGYCSTNAGLTPDSTAVFIGNVPPFENNGWLRAVACEDSLTIDFHVFDCQNGNELGFFLFTGDCDTLTLKSFVSAKDGNLAHLTAGGITPGEPFFIVVDGFYGAECKFQTHVASGIGTAEPGISSCSCTDGYIDGPTDLCPADIATYTLVPPQCNITPGQPVGGDGVYYDPPIEVCLPFGQNDSMVLHWVIPPSMNYLSDSVNVYTITVQVDSSLLGVDTVLNGQISVYWETIDLPDIDTVAMDTNAYCSCNTANCVFTTLPLDITIHHDVEYEYGVLTCTQPCYFYNGQPYCAPGIDTLSQTNCLTQYLVLTQDQIPPTANAGPDQSICLGESATIGAGVPNPLYIFDWGSGPTNPVTSVSPSVTTTYTLVVTNTFNGCTASDDVTVFVAGNGPIFVTAPPITICEGDCATLDWGDVVCPTASQSFQTILVSFQGCDSTVNQSVVVQPQQVINFGTIGTLTCNNPAIDFMGDTYTSPGLYQIQDPDPNAPPCQYLSFTVLNDIMPPNVAISSPSTICVGESATLAAISPNINNTYVWSTNDMTPQITVSPSVTTTYTLTTTGVNGCTSTATATLTVNQPQNVQLGVVGTLSCAQLCVTYNGQEYCQPGMYSDTANCVISQFEINYDPTLPTVQLGVVGTLSCAQSCVTYNGQQYCQAGVYLDTSGCSVNQFTIDFDPALPVVQLGTVGFLSCLQPCVTFNGQTYCQAGTYADTANCTISQFTIDVDPTLQVFQLGVVGTLSCGQPCVTFNGQDYCQPGTYSDTANCTINQFEITFDPSLPVLQLGTVGTLSCAQPCATFNGQSYCQPGLYSDTSNCTINQFEIAFDASLPVLQLGVVGTLSCAQPCAMFNGQSYCQPGTYSDTLNCTINQFEIAFDPALSTAQLGVVATLTCAQPCATFNGQSYCQPGMYSDTSNCTINQFEIAFDGALQTVQLGIVGMLTCAQPCTTYNGLTYCQAGTYTDTLNCQIQEFMIGYDSVLPVVQLGVLDTLSCAQPCVVYDGKTYCLSGTYSQTVGCEIQQFDIVDQPAGSLELGSDQTILTGESATLQALTNTQPVSISWQAQGAPIPGDELSLLVAPTENTLYSIEIQDINGCLLNDSLWVFVKSTDKGWYAPTAFTPGNGGPNGWFTLFTDTNRFTEIRSIDIYNRWGEQVFSRKNLAPNVPEIGWGGEMNGKLLDPAVFVWQAELLLSDGTTTRISGDVTLLR
ncbi:MAG: gliding motility-associated C-terminal domain-containing protein [Lewinellaceae bacterium]|nr:gliding motility-associated C-terminal domain-containing protein [Lewinellaceae bacterium]